jgi:hypothetical protein
MSEPTPLGRLSSPLPLDVFDFLNDSGFFIFALAFDWDAFDASSSCQAVNGDETITLEFFSPAYDRTVWEVKAIYAPIVHERFGCPRHVIESDDTDDTMLSAVKELLQPVTQ